MLVQVQVIKIIGNFVEFLRANLPLCFLTLQLNNNILQVRREKESFFYQESSLVKKKDVLLGISATSFIGCVRYMSLVMRKSVFGVSDQFRHKPGCTAIEDG